jgi:VCBS repeat-containing protein
VPCKRYQRYLRIDLKGVGMIERIFCLSCRNSVAVVGSLLSAGLVLLVSATSAQAATCSISTSPSPATIDVGQSVSFSGSVSGKSPKTYAWTFVGGSPASWSTPSVSVTYASVGNFGATLNGTDGRGGTCSANVTVIVNAVGNHPPSAQDDEYNTQENVSLAISAPGVLINDSDPDAGDTVTAAPTSGTTAQGGSYSLLANGSFTYTPAADFKGSDSFTYHATDGQASSNTATVTITVAAVSAVSINSTSANGISVPLNPVTEEPWDVNPNYALLAINDLGMHCGDLDTRISSILPPFNVLHAQVVRRGDATTGLPRVMNEGEVTLEYSAVSNPDDPAPGRVAGGLATSSVAPDGSVYRTNFWDIAFQAYDPFYPSGILALFSTAVDTGLPMPDVERYYLEDGFLGASQQAMPGINIPYSDNDPQAFKEHIGTFPFFTTFAFGYTANVNFFEAAGVPITPFDDYGRENPYPLVRVKAKVDNTGVATRDTVVPISGEASCQSCHSADVGTGIANAKLNGNTAMAADDPAYNAHKVPFDVAVEWASDINLLRLHDVKEGSKYGCATPSTSNSACLDNGYDSVTGKSNDPVVCQRCHYTPALDLAQLGPLGSGPEGNDSARDVTLDNGTPGGLPFHIVSMANGRDQLKQPTMSNVMHSFHGKLDASGKSPGDTGYDTNDPLFPLMPPAIDGTGHRRSQATTQTLLEASCYNCHPGKRTQCMRGAMANGGLVCQDCHGQITQVGNDFSRNVSPTNSGINKFEVAADFYTNPATPRVPWANEPSCGSCHTGYATDNLAGTANVLVNPTDTRGNTDGIRLLAAYRTNDPKAAAIVPTNKAFAENVVAEGTAADGNPKLYRVSTGHGGLFCEACHGSTHAEWPAANPSANENVMAKQTQGHSGYIAECTVCHEPTDTSLPLGNNGPHGMHPVVDLDPVAPAKVDDRWNYQHRNYRQQGPGCESCHGADLKGTVLSRTADDRTVHCKDRNGSLPECAAMGRNDPPAQALIPKGTPVGCGMCHRQK